MGVSLFIKHAVKMIDPLVSVIVCWWGWRENQREWGGSECVVCEGGVWGTFVQKLVPALPEGDLTVKHTRGSQTPGLGLSPPAWTEFQWPHTDTWMEGGVVDVVDIPL